MDQSERRLGGRGDRIRHAERGDAEPARPGDQSIPLISRDSDYGGLIYLGPYFNLLPFFAVALMVVQQKMMTPPPADKEQEMQQKMMRWMMIIFGLFFYKIAAGLCIYIITSTLWSFAERQFLPKAHLTLVTIPGFGHSAPPYWPKLAWAALATGATAVS